MQRVQITRGDSVGIFSLDNIPGEEVDVKIPERSLVHLVYGHPEQLEGRNVHLSYVRPASYGGTWIPAYTATVLEETTQ